MAMTKETSKILIATKQIVGGLILKKVFCRPELQVFPLDPPSQMMETVMEHHSKQGSNV